MQQGPRDQLGYLSLSRNGPLEVVFEINVSL